MRYDIGSEGGYSHASTVLELSTLALSLNPLSLNSLGVPVRALGGTRHEVPSQGLHPMGILLWCGLYHRVVGKFVGISKCITFRPEVSVDLFATLYPHRF